MHGFLLRNSFLWVFQVKKITLVIVDVLGPRASDLEAIVAWSVSVMP